MNVQNNPIKRNIKNKINNLINSTEKTDVIKNKPKKLNSTEKMDVIKNKRKKSHSRKRSRSNESRKTSHKKSHHRFSKILKVNSSKNNSSSSKHHHHYNNSWRTKKSVRNLFLFTFNFFSEKNEIIPISKEVLNIIKQKNEIEENRYNKLLEEQKFLPKLIPLLKPINSEDYLNTSSSEFFDDSYDDDLERSYNNNLKEKNYKNNNNNNNNNNRYNERNKKYRNYYKNNINYNYKNNYYNGYNNIINDSFHRDFEEFQLFRQFINLKYSPLYYKNK